MAELIEIKLTDIQRDPNQPRQDFNEAALKELADSIRARGVMQAITIRHTPEGHDGPRFMIIAGERRWRASQIAGQDTIPCILKTGDEAGDDTIRAQQLTENLFREDLNPVEQAEFIQSRIDELKISGINDAVSHVATELGVSNSWVSKKTAVLKLSDDLRRLAKVGKIRDYSIVKKLDKLKGEKRQSAIQQIEDGSFNAKEFFKRKRYDKNTGDNVSQNVPERQPSQKTKSVNTLSFNTLEAIQLIEKTEFSVVLKQADPLWKEKEDLFPEYFKKFKAWVTKDIQSKGESTEYEQKNQYEPA